MIIAGAGSGKTRVITHRVAHLILELGVPSYNILAVTFTNKAAGEMKQRVEKILQQANFDLGLPLVATFHSFCVRILRADIDKLAIERSFTIYDDKDSLSLIKKIVKKMGLEEDINIKQVASYIDKAKNNLWTSADLRANSSYHLADKITQIYAEYQRELKAADGLDFGDLISRTVELFQKFPDVLDKYQERFKYIMVDEYQDTNEAQYVLTNLLAQKYRNLVVVGDDDQAIYSWRGANIQNILSFEDDFPEAKVVKLEQNYRSTQNILDAAWQVICKNSGRKEKKLWTEQGRGDLISLVECFSEVDEGERIIGQIEDLILERRARYRDFALLYRTNAQSRVLEEAFLRHGIPYQIIGGVKFYARKEVKDIIAYLRLLLNENDVVSLLRVINVPPRKIGEKTIETVQNFANTQGLSFWQALLRTEEIDSLGPQTKVAISRFVEVVLSLRKEASKLAVSSLVRQVIERSGYKKMLMAEATEENKDRMGNLEELLSVAKKYDQMDRPDGLLLFLEEVALVSDLDNMEEGKNGVILMTLHNAKGLEFPYVFVTGMEEELFPHFNSLDDAAALEEERRLCYVGMTRAKKKLFLTLARSRLIYGTTKNNEPSRFLLDISPDLLQGAFVGSLDAVSNYSTDDEYSQEPEYMDINAGDLVSHPTFGRGKVVSVQGGVATVSFDNDKYGVKRLALSVAPLEKEKDF